MNDKTDLLNIIGGEPPLKSGSWIRFELKFINPQHLSLKCSWRGAREGEIIEGDVWIKKGRYGGGCIIGGRKNRFFSDETTFGIGKFVNTLYMLTTHNPIKQAAIEEWYRLGYGDVKPLVLPEAPETPQLPILPDGVMLSAFKNRSGANFINIFTGNRNLADLTQRADGEWELRSGGGTVLGDTAQVIHMLLQEKHVTFEQVQDFYENYYED